MSAKKDITKKVNNYIYKSGNAKSKTQQTKIKRGGLRLTWHGCHSYVKYISRDANYFIP